MVALEKIKEPENHAVEHYRRNGLDSVSLHRKKYRSTKKDRTHIRARQNRLAPWIPNDVWARYEWAREVYAFTNLDYHQMERGFDYALTHHQLSTRHALRKQTAADPLPQERWRTGREMHPLRQAYCLGWRTQEPGY
ncbi:MAG: hypothetical protein R3F37_17935 [Candidatus Competibacteraceae bacterium]